VVTAILKRQAAMKKKKGERRSTKARGASLVRASISFPPDLYETLEEIAKQKKVSLAWVVRDAAEKYVADRPAATTTRSRPDTPEVTR
jgi:predicted DNA-binding ribbon-helix-helix protein